MERLCEKDEGLLLPDRCSVDACHLKMGMALPRGLSGPLDQASRC